MKRCRVEVVCPVCGKTFETVQSRIDARKSVGKSLCCSRKCGFSPRTKRITRSCAHCGKSITRRASEMRSEKSYCSRQCYHQGRVLTMDRYIKFHVGTRGINETTVREHRLIWEEAYGPLSPDMNIHHINGNKSDNRLENLMAVPMKKHMMLHNGWVMNEQGDWIGKTCPSCNQFLDPNEFVMQPSGKTTTYCKRCRGQKAKKHRQSRESVECPS